MTISTNHVLIIYVNPYTRDLPTNTKPLYNIYAMLNQKIFTLLSGDSVLLDSDSVLLLFFIHFKLELLTLFPAWNNKKYFSFLKNTYPPNEIALFDY